MRSVRRAILPHRTPTMTSPAVHALAHDPAHDEALARDLAAHRLRDRERGASRLALEGAERDGLARALIASPVGPMLAIAGDDGLHSLWFLDDDHGLRPSDTPSAPPSGEETIQALRRELDEYFAGRRRRFDVRCTPHGTPFQESVWRELLRIECGTTVTYGSIARALGKPQASRAVGLAVGRNPISILVPCHRVIGENGTLTGYAGGLPRKRYLLGLELREAELVLRGD